MRNSIYKFHFIIILIISLFGFVANSYAYSRHDGNCNEGNVKYYKALVKDGSILKGNKIITKDVVLVAIQNLEKYCDDAGEGLQTPIFANQIIDVAFRKVDGIKGLAYGVKLDELGKKYREQMNEIEKEYKTKPDKLTKVFKKAWGTAEQNISPNENTLYGRYQLVCQEYENMSDKLLSYSSKNNKVSPMPDGSLSSACYDKARRKYNKGTKLMTKVTKQNFYHEANEKLYKQLGKFMKGFSKVFDGLALFQGNLEFMTRRIEPQGDVHQG